MAETTVNALPLKAVFGIVIAAMFAGCVILAIESENVRFLPMFLGYFVCFAMAFVVMYMRFTPLIIGAAVVFLLACYGAYKIEWSEAIIGAAAGILTVVMMQFGWVRPHMKDSFEHDDYVKGQQAIHGREKEEGLSYTEQQKALYEKDKAEKDAGKEPEAPKA